MSNLLNTTVCGPQIKVLNHPETQRERDKNKNMLLSQMITNDIENRADENFSQSVICLLQVLCEKTGTTCKVVCREVKWYSKDPGEMKWNMND